MIHFITREDLLQWLERHCTRKAVVRALQEGTVEHLGAFTKLGPNGNPGWIVQVTSETGSTWIIEVIAESKRKRYGIFIRSLLPIPWEYWDGVEYRLKTVSRIDGDNPIKYARLRDKHRKEKPNVSKISTSA